jgi:hypothetical protein
MLWPPNVVAPNEADQAGPFRPRSDAGAGRPAAAALSFVVLGVLAAVGLTGRPAIHALRILRPLVRGFVPHEMTSSFLEPLDYIASGPVRATTNRHAFAIVFSVRGPAYLLR